MFRTAQFVAHEHDRDKGVRYVPSEERPATESPMPVSTGFVPSHPRFHRLYNVVLGSLLLLVALPMIALLALALLATQGWHVFYRGTRIGRGGASYEIVKFRTLNGRKAQEITRDTVLPADSGIETPLGGFLRDTRLDELPQLFNVVMGDMNICGPRPVRPEIAAIQRARIPGYDVRFRVRPGLIGHTQAYMHHGTSKAIRARYNNVLCRSRVRYRGELRMVALVGACVMSRTLWKVWDRVVGTTLGRGADHRAADAAAACDLAILDEHGARHRVDRVDRTTLSLSEHGQLPKGRGVTLHGRLVMTLRSGKLRTAAVALVEGDGGRYAYRARTDYGHHVVSRYLWRAVVVPHGARRWWGAALERQARRLREARFPHARGFAARSLANQEE